jgi:LPXTG-motif cell wall-anchored protein
LPPLISTQSRSLGADGNAAEPVAGVRIMDSIEVNGLLRHLAALEAFDLDGRTGVLTGKLLGPMPATDIDPENPCAGVDWSKAPVIGEIAETVISADGRYSAPTFQTEASDVGCTTWTMRLAVSPLPEDEGLLTADDLTFVHEPGLPSETLYLREPTPPTGRLPLTGADPLLLAAIGGTLLLAGLLVVDQRARSRRRNRIAEDA